VFVGHRHTAPFLFRPLPHRSFYNADGDMMIVPESGTMHITTELGKLRLKPGEVFVLPRGLKMTVDLENTAKGARGWVCEVFNDHFQLPDTGVIGHGHLADARHFLAPTPSFEDRLVDGYRLTCKFGGNLFEAKTGRSPYDVVAWHGNYTPYKYSLLNFSPVGAVKHDHIDPSSQTVLTVPGVVDFLAFVGRWTVGEDTFKPVYCHRNYASELNCIVKIDEPYAGFQKGSTFLTPMMTGHGITSDGYRNFAAKSKAAADAPQRLSDDSLWVMFESPVILKLTHWARTNHKLDKSYRSRFSGYPRGKVPV
jgi:homogentisate 1,2-dioxygenase